MTIVPVFSVEALSDPCLKLTSYAVGAPSGFTHLNAGHVIGNMRTIDAGDTLSGHLPAIPAPATLFLAVLFSSLFVQFALPMTCLLANCNKQCSCGL